MVIRFLQPRWLMAAATGRSIGIVVAALALVVALPWAGVAAERVGAEMCVACHEDVGADFSKTMHGVAWRGMTGETPYDCESCHGPGGDHAESGDPADIVNPGRMLGVAANELCVTCHKSDVTGWKARKIERFDLSCMSCHTAHQPAIKGNLKAPEPAVCYQCHQRQLMDFRLPSHHPLREGNVKCTSCHKLDEENPFAMERPNDLCLECHAAYRGPFVFEHAPVSEDCSICHAPHGAVADNLLKQNEPFVCLQCHQMHFHTTLQGFEGEFTTPLNPDRGGPSGLDGWKRGMLTKCTQCHGQVHGSDLPGQSISGMGKSLTR